MKVETKKGRASSVVSLNNYDTIQQPLFLVLSRWFQNLVKIFEHIYFSTMRATIKRQLQKKKVHEISFSLKTPYTRLFYFFYDSF